ncbi:hypothetical protein TELCIR_25154, partial [Teladorsagia circumcincta]
WAMRQLAGFLSFVFLVVSTPDELHLTTNDEGYLTVIQGFAAQLNCAVNTCSPNVIWMKDDILIFNGTKFAKPAILDEKSYKLQHKVDVDFEK